MQQPSQPCKVKEFFIFNRYGICLCHIDLQNDENINKANCVITDRKLENRYKLIFGLLFSMKTFVKKISTNPDNEKFKNFKTSEYKLHYLELINGLRFIILSSPTNSDYASYLNDIYNSFYVSLISLNPFIDKNSTINNQVFLDLTRTYLSSINNY